MGLAAAVIGAVGETGAAILGAGALATVGGIASASIGAGAAKSAAQTQATAEQQAAQIQQQNYQQIRSDLSPFVGAGTDATSQLQNYSPFSFQPTQAQLEATPGYQFNLSQGLKSVQNGYAARGLGTSGAAMKGAATYASGLADTTYQNQFSNALNTYNTNLGRLQNLSNLGENAAAQTGQFGTATAQSVGQTIVGAANASAAGTVGAANAAVGGINAGIGGLSNALLFNSFLRPSSTAAPASIYSDPTGAAGAYAAGFGY